MLLSDGGGASGGGERHGRAPRPYSKAVDTMMQDLKVVSIQSLPPALREQVPKGILFIALPSAVVQSLHILPAPIPVPSIAYAISIPSYHTDETLRSRSMTRTTVTPPSTPTIAVTTPTMTSTTTTSERSEVGRSLPCSSVYSGSGSGSKRDKWDLLNE